MRIQLEIDICNNNLVEEKLYLWDNNAHKENNTDKMTNKTQNKLEILQKKINKVKQRKKNKKIIINIKSFCLMSL